MKKILTLILITISFSNLISQNWQLGFIGQYVTSTGKTYPSKACHYTYESLGGGEHQIDFAINATSGVMLTVKYIKIKNGNYLYKVNTKLSLDSYANPREEYVISDKPLRKATQIAFQDMSGAWVGWLSQDIYNIYEDY